MAKKSAASKGYRKQAAKKPFLTKKEIIILCVAAVVLIGAFIVLLSYDDGALKVKDGAVVTEGDNWLITNGAAAQNNVRYFKVGEVGDIEGYTRETVDGLYGANTPEYTYTPGEDGGDIDTISVSTYPAKAARLAEYYAGELPKADIVRNTVSDIRTGEANGTAYTYYIHTSEYLPGTEEEAAEGGEESDRHDSCGRSATAYIDTIKDSSVIVSVGSAADTLEECAGEDALLAALNTAVGAITLEK